MSVGSACKNMFLRTFWGKTQALFAVKPFFSVFTSVRRFIGHLELSYTFLKIKWRLLKIFLRALRTCFYALFTGKLEDCVPCNFFFSVLYVYVKGYRLLGTVNYLLEVKLRALKICFWAVLDVIFFIFIIWGQGFKTVLSLVLLYQWFWMLILDWLWLADLLLEVSN